MKKLPYIAIIILLLIILFQNRSCKSPIPAPKIDTVTVYIPVKDTITIEKPVLIATKKDTVWMKKEENTPDSTYQGLLNQYTELGNRYFTTNVFQNRFKISDYGSITVTDSVYGNWLINSSIFTDLNIPITTITIEKPVTPKNQFYTGVTFTGNKITPLTAVYGNLLLKTKKDKIYAVSIGWDGERTNYAFSLYWKIKLRK